MVRSNSKQEMTEFALLEVITPSLAVGKCARESRQSTLWTLFVCSKI